MTNLNAQHIIHNIYSSLEKRNLKEAFDQIAFLLSNLQNWQLKETLSEIENTYKTMLRYLTEGVKDPERKKVYYDLLRSTYRLTDTAILELNTRENPSFFYEKRRTLRVVPSESYLILIQSLEDIAGKMALASLLEDEGTEKHFLLKTLSRETEKVSSRIFQNAWLSDPWNLDERDKWREVLNNKLYPFEIQCMILSALTLNLQEVFDEKKALLLLEACENENEEIRQRALTGILLFLRKYNHRITLYPEIGNRLQHMAEDNRFIRDIRHIILQFILSRETEKITRRIQEEILPDMMKISPELSTKIKLEDLMSETGTDEKNPEWKNLLEESGLNDKLQEFSELQLEGADVMHSSFTHLKTFSFFNEIGNWFIPFSLKYDEVEGADSNELLKVLMESSVLCNSDKYSFYFSVRQMPDSFKKMMTGQIAADSDAIREMLKEELADNSKKINPIARQYIQDLYRFYKIHPRKKDFEDIFEASPDFYAVGSIARLIGDNESQLTIGEYYFNRNYYAEAGEIFGRLLQTDPGNDILYQKRGYCLQMQGLLQDALEAYLKAELFNTSNPWTIKKIAYCYRVLKQPENALAYYHKAEQLNPDNLSIQLSIGHCHLELKNYQDALKCYFKVEYLDKNKEKAWRPIAWCSFLTGKYEQARDYFTLILENNPGAADFLNSGHTQLAMGHTKEAIRMYELSARHPESSMEKFKEAFAGDIPDLIHAGILEEDIPFLIDRLIYGTELD